MIEAVFFYAFAALAVVSALYVVTTRNPTYAVLSLILTMIALAVLFLLLKAYFIAAIHLLVYAGAIMVLFLFVVMLLGVGKDEERGGNPWPQRFFGGLVVTAFLVEIAIFARAFVSSAAPGRVEGTIESVGRLLFTQYLIPFEITSFLLLVGIVGAVVLAKKETV